MAQSYIYESNNEEDILNFTKKFIDLKNKFQPDFIYIEGKILTKDISEIKNKLKYKSFTGDKRVVLLKINSITSEAQNSMLKLLEETNQDTTMILAIKNSNRLLDTIKSRCILIKDNNIIENKYDIKSFLKMRIEDRLEFIINVEDEEDFIINLFSYIMENYKEISDLSDKIIKINDIQKAINNNVQKKLILTDISLNL